MTGRAVRGRYAVLAAGVVALVTGCAPALSERAAEEPRAAYERELRRLRPHGEALARQWAEAGDAAARTARGVSLPFDGRVELPGATPAAVAYRFTARAGDRVQAAVHAPGQRPRAVFVELFEVVRGDQERLLLIARADRGSSALRTLVPRGGEYVLLVQPRVDQGGAFRVTVGTGSATIAPVVADPRPIGVDGLFFPVEGRSPSAIGSPFGAPRDGGVRAHHGVDIFAPRGTPVLAAADGRVTQVANTAVGGLIVWQRVDGTGIELYYAHLDAQHVRTGQHVRAGEIIGTVGNTGNARTTPPHLHFGVYSPGRTPLDPAPLLANGMLVTDRPVAQAPPPASPRPPAATRTAGAAGEAGAGAGGGAGGGERRVEIPGATVRVAGPGFGAAAAPPSAGAVAAADAAGPTGPNVTAGPSAEIVLAGPPIEGVGEWRLVQSAGAQLLAAPAAGAAAVAALGGGTAVRLTGGSATWPAVVLPDGRTGFVSVEALARVDGAPGGQRAISARTPLRELLSADARVIETIYGGEHVDVLAVYQQHLLVRTTTGQVGWIAIP
jgi:peptidoglycan LD-endopeptidase LytH